MKHRAWFLAVACVVIPLLGVGTDVSVRADGPAAADPAVAKIFEKYEKFLEGAERLEIEYDQRLTPRRDKGGMKEIQVIKGKYRVVLQKPSCKRTESIREDGSVSHLSYRDGSKTRWMYFPELNTARSTLADDTGFDARNRSLPAGRGLFTAFFGAPDLNERLAWLADLSRLAKEEVCNGTACRVVRAEVGDESMTVWFSVQDGLPRRVLMEHGNHPYFSRTEVTFHSIKAGRAEDPAFFRFIPPAGVEIRHGYGAETETEEPALLPNGSPAPDFDVTDTPGKRVRLSDCRGKAVLLNFWVYC